MSESVTSLRLKVDSTDVKNAEKDLNNLTKASGSAEKSASSTSTSFLSLNKVLASGAALGLAMQYIKLSDTMTGMQSKLKIVTSSTQELTTAQEELFKIAQKTRQGYAETVDTYSNFAVSMGEMGKSQKEILRVTETVNKAIAISGGTAQQAAAATMQLGQAFASGTLRGDELNSILENSKGLAQAIADGMGVPIGKLRSLGAEGKITAEILANALEKSAQSVDEKFGKVGATVEQSMTMISNSLLKVVGEMDNATGASSALAGSISSLSDIFTSAANSLHNFNIEILRLQDVKKIKTLDDANIALKQIDDEIKGLTTSTDLIDRMGRALNGEVQNRAKLNNLYAAQASLNKKVNTIANEELAIQDKKDKAYKNRVIDTTVVKKEKKAGKTEAEKLEEERIKQTVAINEEIASLRASDYEKQQLEIEKSVKEYRKAGVSKSEIDRLVSLKQGEYLEAEYNKAQEQFTKLDEAKLTSLNAQSQMMADNYIAMYDQHLKFSLSTFEYDMMKLNEQKEIYLKATEDKLTVDAWYEEQKKALINKQASEDVSKSLEPMQTMLDTQIALAESGQDWASSLTGVAGSMADVIKGIQKVNVIGLKTDKSLIASQEKYAKKFLEANGNVAKEKEAMAEFDTEQADIKDKQFSAEMGAYYSLAGSMASMYEQGSNGAIAFSAIQSALGIASSWTAIANAWALPFPANIGAAAMVASQVMPIIAQLGGGGGGGGGVSSSIQSTMDTAKFESKQSEAIIDRLDRQIKLLESIDQGGTAARSKVSLAGATFEADIAKMWADMLGSAGSTTAITQHRASSLTGDKLADVQYVIGWLDSVKNTLRPEDWAFLDMTRSDILTFQSDLESAVTDFAMNLSDVKDTVKDSSEGFKQIYDSLSGTDFYKIRDLNKAFDELGNSIVGNSQSSMLSYISTAVTGMEKFGEDYIATTKSILEDGTIDQQVAKLKELSEAFNVTFNNSTEEALNFLDSIELVTEAMITSNDNIKSFIDSMLTTDQKSQNLAQSMGISLATNTDELIQLFNKLSNDTEGLTDSELELLITNKELISNTDSYNKTLDETSKSISTLEGALSTITSTIEKLRSASRTSEQNLQIFYDAMAEAQRLSGTDDYAAYAEAVKKAADTSSALFNKDNFALTRDMEYAQLVAANQFEDLQDNTLTQVDILKQIEENTRLQVTAITEAMNNFGMSINAQLLQALKQKEPKKLLEQWDKGQWESTGGAIATGSGANYSITSTSGDTISSTEAIGFVNSQLQAGDPMAVYNAALATGISANSLDAMMGWASGTSNEWASLQNLPSFAVGTANVTNDMLANIHKGEIITPAPFADGLRNGSLMMGNQNSLVNELQKNNSLLSGIITKQDQQIQVLLESRDIQNGSLIELENIGVII